MTVVVYGFAAFMLIRHTNKAYVKAAAIIVTLILCILSGLSPLFFNTQYPSDVAAGYVFGGVWLSLNIILLEVYRILPKIQFQ
jgi:membrane-associated phospholipid phosphatase